MLKRESLSLEITYLVAVKNKAKTIGRCLNSILKQDVNETIVVDGKSTDGTSELIDKFLVTHLVDEGTSLAAARNLGLHRCTGDYLVIVDGDQWIPDGFNQELKAILQTGGWDVVFCNEVWVGSSVYAKAHQEAWVQASKLRYDRLYRPRVLSSSIIQKVGGWNEEFTSFEDADLWERIKKLDPRIYKSMLTLFSDASNLSVLSQFSRGRWYGSRLAKFVKHHPAQWEEITSVAPLGFIADFILAATVLISTRSILTALAALVTRLACSIGWALGVLEHL